MANCSTLRRALRGLGYRYKRPRYVLAQRSHRGPVKRGLKRGLRERLRTGELLLNETIIIEAPPLQEAWTLRGQQAQVRITGNRNKPIL